MDHPFKVGQIWWHTREGSIWYTILDIGVGEEGEEVIYVVGEAFLIEGEKALVDRGLLIPYVRWWADEDWDENIEEILTETAL